MSSRRRTIRALSRVPGGWWALPAVDGPGERPLVLDGPPNGAGDGDLVLCEPAPDGATARAVGPVVARAGSLRSEMYRIALEAGRDPTYPPQVLAEARAARTATALDDPALADLRAIPFVTIDSHDARDLDQALHIAAEADGTVVRYAIADASHFVRPGSALLEESLERGASYYLPGLAVPMLPRGLSEGIISLNPGVERRAVVFQMRLDDTGACRSTEVVRARMRSVRRLSFRQVQRLWDDPAGSPLRTASFAPSLRLVEHVGSLLEAEAHRRHVVSFHRRELEVRLDGERGGFVVLARDRLPAEHCNEQLSLLCNVEGARLLAASRRHRHVQPVFRVHPAPPEEALARLAGMVDAVSAQRGIDLRWRRDAGEPLASWVGRLPRRGRLAGVARALERQALLTNRRSTFETEPAPHHGIGAPVYARFTAPMREVVGIFAHKEAFEALGGGRAAEPDAADVALRERVVTAANRARELQRALTKRANRAVLDRIFRAELAGAGPPPEHPGFVLGVTPSRLYVGLDDPPVEVKIDLDRLEAAGGGRWTVDHAEVAASPPADADAEPIRLGDRVVVVVSGEDRDRDRWRFSVRRA